MELSGYLAVARRWWWTLLVATWVAAVSAYVVGSQIPPTYEARAQALVGPYNTDRETLGAAGSLVQTYSELVTTTPILQSAIAETGADITPGALEASTRVTADGTTRFLSIRVQHTDPQTAAALANALADEIALIASRGTNRPEGQVQIVDVAEPPIAPVAPQVSLIVGLAALAALIGALVLVMLVEYLSSTVRTEEDLDRLTSLPMLGRVDASRSLPTSRSLIDSIPESAAAAAYRLVLAKVAFRDAEHPVRSIAIVGAGPENILGQVASNLAAITARGGRRVVLIDGDGAGAAVTRIFRLTDRPGLADVIDEPDTPVSDGLVRVSTTLQVLPVGQQLGDSVDSDSAAQILAEARDRADLVIVNAGALHLSAGALVWARAADATLIVAVRDQSRRDDVTYAVESLRLVSARLSGTVLVDRKRSLGRPARRAASGERERVRPAYPEPIERSVPATPEPAPEPATVRRGRRPRSEPDRPRA